MNFLENPVSGSFCGAVLGQSAQILSWQRSPTPLSNAVDHGLPTLHAPLGSASQGFARILPRTASLIPLSCHMREINPTNHSLSSHSPPNQTPCSIDKYRKGKKLLNEDIPVYISDFLPPEIKEMKRREREIFKKNEQDQSNGIEMNMTKNGLEIQGSQYIKKVTAPDSTKVLSYTEVHLNRICQMQVESGEEIHENGSQFIGYILPTNNHSLINDAYMKLRLIHPQASSIICSYSIPGLPRCYHEDYCDDKEVGGGNFLLKLLQKNKIACTAFFVVRIHEGTKIGPIRFELMETAIRSALLKHPYNKFINANQAISTEQLKIKRGDVNMRAGAPNHRSPRVRSSRGQLRGNSARGTYIETTKRR